MTALMLHAAHRIGIRTMKNRWTWGIAAASFIAIFAFDTLFPAIVPAAALFGHFGARRWQPTFAPGGAHGSAMAGSGAALTDDHTPTPEHARFPRRRVAPVLAAGVGLWLLAMFFAHHVRWPQGFGGCFDWTSALIGAAVAVALFRFKLGVMPLLAASAAAGLAVRWLWPLSNRRNLPARQDPGRAAAGPGRGDVRSATAVRSTVCPASRSAPCRCVAQVDL